MTNEREEATGGRVHTAGPWHPSTNGSRFFYDASGRVLGEVEHLRDIHVVAAAPDLALLGWAMCVGAGRWELHGDLAGEFCINGIRHFTKLDEFGCPEMTAGMREAISKARATGATK